MTLEEIEQHNIKVYKEHGANNGGEKRHICTQCEESVSIDESMSNKGHKLICNKCVYRVFGSVEKAYKWAYE